MNIIIPMAGVGKRMRPYTLTVPKPLIPIAGKPIVQRLVEDIAEVCSEKIDNIGFVTGRFGTEIENKLLEIAEAEGAKGKIFYQDEPLGTAHAVYSAQELLDGPVIIAFADTLFKAHFQLDTNKDGIVWVQQVEDPGSFGVVKLNENSEISGFIEKPQEFVSDLAIIGIYYVKDGLKLRDGIRNLIENDLKENNEFQLTNVLDDLRQQGMKFYPGQVDEWLDCGNKEATVFTNQRYLELIKDKETLISPSVKNHNSVIIPPVYLGSNVELDNAVVGPYVSVGENCKIRDSRIQKSIILNSSTLTNVNLIDSMIGNFVTLDGKCSDVSIGDYGVVMV